MKLMPDVERGVQHALGLVDATPPVAGEGPHAEPDLGDLEIAPTEAAIAHGKLPSGAATRRGAIYCSSSRGSSTGWAPEGGAADAAFPVLTLRGPEAVPEHDREREHDARAHERDDRWRSRGRSGTRSPRRRTKRTIATEQQEVADALREAHCTGDARAALEDGIATGAHLRGSERLQRPVEATGEVLRASSAAGRARRWR